MLALKDILPNVLRSLQDPQKRAVGKLVDQWEAIAGPRIAPHTRPSLGRNGRLYVWVDQSVLAFELNQKYRQSILRRVQAVVGEEVVSDVWFRVGQLRSP